MPGHRMSALPLAQYCGKAPTLSLGAGRAAAMGTAYHARCAGTPGNAALLARLSSEEAEQVLSWQTPTDVVITVDDMPPIVLAYEQAEKEVEVALDEMAGAVDASDPDAETVGHIDFAWVVEIGNHRVAYVADLKKSEWTSSVDSLQLAAYGFAWAARHGCTAFCCGIFAATEGTWTWGNLIYLEKPEGLALWERVLAAARNKADEYSTGPHCSGCFSRLRCPAWVLPPEVALTSLAPIAEGGEITPEGELELLMLVERAEDTIEAAKKALRAHADARGGISSGNGKVWKAVMQKGREGFDVKAAKAALGDALAPYTKRGAPFPVYRWVNEGKELS